MGHVPVGKVFKADHGDGFVRIPMRLLKRAVPCSLIEEAQLHELSNGQSDIARYVRCGLRYPCHSS